MMLVMPVSGTRNDTSVRAFRPPKVNVTWSTMSSGTVVSQLFPEHQSITFFVIGVSLALWVMVNQAMQVMKAERVY
jgi:hypothetical protein